MLNNKYLSLTIIVLITFLASAIGGVVTSAYKEPWYSQIIQPTFSPPSWVFGPVWTTLYLLMSLAVWLSWLSQKDKKTLKIYFIHLIFNTTWSIVFFGLHQILLALVVLMILIFLIVILIIRFKRVNFVSYYLMIPYLLWCCYALFLNFNLLILN